MKSLHTYIFILYIFLPSQTSILFPGITQLRYPISWYSGQPKQGSITWITYPGNNHQFRLYREQPPRLGYPVNSPLLRPPRIPKEQGMSVVRHRVTSIGVHLSRKYFFMVQFASYFNKNNILFYNYQYVSTQICLLFSRK